ncbi:hypothetical protein GJU40_06725 [Bacillus lacus]|uniref:DUF5050 domain-containing protein n=1 Tax=Metabacillus lacus TaxID=1983721 RepID=A0A7X2IXY1_9BACI|nr:hypothetical protein [Metabacillus lacus]MRX71866.1 hypothetical protein [Metabacillus lacus]
MKKTAIVTILSAGLAAAGFFFYTSFGGSTAVTANKEEYQDPDFLKDKQAAIYFSTTADQDIDGSGKSYAAFIDTSGNTLSIQKKGLELGTIAHSDDTLLLEDKQSVTLLGQQYQEFSDSKAQYTGERSGYLPKENLFFSLYNSGFNSNGGYNSDVRLIRPSGLTTGTIPHYITSSGIVNEEVMIVAHNIDTPTEFSLKKVNFEKEISLEDIADFTTSSEQVPQSPVLGDGRYYYVILSDYKNDHDEDVLLYRINPETKETVTFTLAQYRGMEDTGKTIVYNNRRSAYLQDNILYYVNGIGDVFAYNTITETSEKAFSLQDVEQSRRSYNEQAYFTENYLHIFYYSTAKDTYFIDQYDLKSGERVKQQELPDMKNMMNSMNKGRKSVYSYDFVVLD